MGSATGDPPIHEPEAPHALWHEEPGRRRLFAAETLVIYLLVPLFLLVLQGSWHGPQLPWRLVSRYLQNFIVGVCIGGCIHGLYDHFWPRVIRRPPSRLLRVFAHGSTVVAGVVIGGEVAARLMAALWSLNLASLRVAVMRTGLFVSLSIVAFLLVYDELRANARRLQIREERSRLAAVQAELRALQARTNPHFLFNSLNSVASLIPEDPDRAEMMLEKLAAVFRYALEGARRETVPLSAEIAAVSTYLSVEQIRFGERLATEIEIDADPAVQTLLVPPFVLQPLVENAILHGIAAKRDKGTVRLVVACHDGRVLMTVEDDGSGAPADKPPGSRSALHDLQERLRLRYGNAATLSHGPRASGGYLAQVVLPLEAPQPS